MRIITRRVLIGPRSMTLFFLQGLASLANVLSVAGWLAAQGEAAALSRSRRQTTRNRERDWDRMGSMQNLAVYLS